MIKKRFTLTFDDNIVDNLTGIIHEVHSGYDVAMDLSGLLNTLYEENEQLKKDKKFAGVLANHRGEMVGFATALIEDMGSKEMIEMWDNFKGKMYQKWKEVMWND